MRISKSDAMSESFKVLICILGDGALYIYVHTQARKFDKGSLLRTIISERTDDFDGNLSENSHARACDVHAFGRREGSH
jgi:hypothetical protein